MEATGLTTFTILWLDNTFSSTLSFLKRLVSTTLNWSEEEYAATLANVFSSIGVPYFINILQTNVTAHVFFATNKQFNQLYALRNLFFFTRLNDASASVKGFKTQSSSFVSNFRPSFYLLHWLSKCTELFIIPLESK